MTRYAVITLIDNHNHESKRLKCVGCVSLQATVKKLDDKLGFLTPILKGFLSESGVEASNMGIQVYGGHGYIKSNKQEQIARDVRISALWEGTTQIQALDLLGRKIMLQKLKPINEHCARIRADCQRLAFKSGGIGKRARALWYV